MFEARCKNFARMTNFVRLAKDRAAARHRHDILAALLLVTLFTVELHRDTVY